MKTTPMISKKRVIAFAMACCLMLLSGCVEDKPLSDTGSEAATQEETTTEETTTEQTTTQTEATGNDAANDEAMGEDHDGWEIPPDAYPSQEEIDQAMMQEAQEAMQNQYEQYEPYYDYDSSLGKRGR